MLKTGYFWNRKCEIHEMGRFHPESPERLKAIKQVLDGDGVGRELISLDADYAKIDDILAIHDEDYINSIRATAKNDGYVNLDSDTSANAFTWDASRLAVGGTIKCVDSIMNRDTTNAFAFIRPPGHHAERNRAMGFCIFNNIAIVTEHLLKMHDVEKVLIVDFDVHHGNGTQHAFYARSDVFYVSMHRYPFYPGTGSESETGTGEGMGFTLNVPMNVGSNDDDYMRAFDRVAKAVFDYAPQFVLVSAGYDAHVSDPLGGMRLSTDGYRRIMRILCEIADESCNGRLCMVLEGGYNIRALRASVETQLEVMLEFALR